MYIVGNVQAYSQHWVGHDGSSSHAPNAGTKRLCSTYRNDKNMVEICLMCKSSGKVPGEKECEKKSEERQLL